MVEASALSIGPQPVVATNISQGTIFVSPTGTGTTCSISVPCDIFSAINKAVSGDVVFLRGGTYTVSQIISIPSTKSGTAAAPIIFESYPGETAILEGSNQLAKNGQEYFRIYGNYIQVRRIEVRNMPAVGVWVGGNNNLLDGLHVHHNSSGGIQISSPVENFAYGTYGSRNIIRNSISHSNSDVGLFGTNYENGGGADGIAISVGTDNRIENCLVYGNSDDGLDTWRSTNSYVGYNITHSNGIGGGDGNGIKAGGISPSANTLVEHNLSYANKSRGIDYNTGVNIKFLNNTTWNNNGGGANSLGYELGSDTIATNNIAADNVKKRGNGIETNNSWQRSGAVTFISTDPTSPSFLVPTSNGGFADIGAYVGVTIGGSSIQPDLVVTQVSYSHGVFKATVKKSGSWSNFFR